jgi:hypothetical protein
MKKIGWKDEHELFDLYFLATEDELCQYDLTSKDGYTFDGKLFIPEEK